MPPNRLKPPPKNEGVALLNRIFLHQYHMRLLTLFGGTPGWREPDIMDDVLERARVRAGPKGEGDPLEVAATYGIELSRAPFDEGNLRLALVAMAASLMLNGMQFDPPQQETVTMMQRLAQGQVDVPSLAAWLRQYVRARTE